VSHQMKIMPLWGSFPLIARIGIWLSGAGTRRQHLSAPRPDSLPQVSVGTAARDLQRPSAVGIAAPLRALQNPTVAAVAALTVLAAVLRFAAIGHQGFWFDEANTANDVHFSPGAMFGLLPQNETTPPLFYAVAWVWARVFGFGEVSLRALPALAGVATVPIVYLSARKLISSRAGLVAAALTACNPFLIWYSQEFRPYEPMVLLSAVGLLAFAYALEHGSTRAIIAWAVASALGLATHYYALLAVIPEAVWLLYSYRADRRVIGAIALVGACGLALLPLAISQNSTGNASWIAPIPLLPRLGQILPQFLTGFQTPAEQLLQRTAEVIALLALVLLAARADAGERRGALIAGKLVLAGFVLNLLLIVGGVDDLITRNVLALWPLAVVLVAGGLGARRAGALGVGATVLLCAIGVFATVSVATDRSFQRPDWRGVGRVLGARPSAGTTRMVLVQRYRDLLPLLLYLPRLQFAGGAGARVSELDVVSIGSPRVPLCWWGAACNLSGSRMQHTYAIPGFHVLWRRHAYQFTIMRLVADRPTLVTPEAVSRALTTTPYRKDELLIQPS
jgi:Dolichyl-phosphate-mannose-protein mannosyltransferase